MCLIGFVASSNPNLARSPAEAIVLSDKQFSQNSDYIRGEIASSKSGNSANRAKITSRSFQQRSPLNRHCLFVVLYVALPLARNRCAFIGTEFFFPARSRVADIMRLISRYRGNDLHCCFDRSELGSGILSDPSARLIAELGKFFHQIHQSQR